MSENEVPGAGERAAANERKILQRKTIKFVVVFVVSVFGLLVAYGMLEDTRGNDLYLYQVGRSTAWLLSLVGDSARVVGDPRTYPGKEAYVRASLEAWRNGEDAPDSGEFQGADAMPLTPWESWEYSAVSQRRELESLIKTWDERGEAWRSDPVNRPQVEKMKVRIQRLQSREVGPTVSFVLRRGLASEIADVRQGLATVQQEAGLTDEERSARVAGDKDRLQKLERKEAELAETDPEAVNGLAFSFVVIPDCGAIPTMVIFVSAVLAFPARWWKKLVGIGAGLPILYSVNTLRLTVLAVIGAWNHGGSVFRFAHEYVWQGVYIIFVVVTWLAWVELLVRRKKAG